VAAGDPYYRRALGDEAAVDVGGWVFAEEFTAGLCGVAAAFGMGIRFVTGPINWLSFRTVDQSISLESAIWF
jgi:hypothetical protein